MNGLEDVAEAVFRRRIEAARGLDPADKLLAGPKLFERACRLATAGLRHAHPDADEATIRLLADRQLAVIRRLETPQ